MKRVAIKEKQFSEINDKRCYIPDGVLSLPYRYPSLNKTREWKEIYIKIIRKYIIISYK